MLIENDNHFHTLYVVVRLSALYKKTWILMRLKKMKMVIVFILRNENGYRFHSEFSTIFKSFPQGCGNRVEKKS